MKLLICCELFNFFAVKLKLPKKSSSFLLLRVTLTSYVVLAMKKSNKFQCVQATKIIKPKRCQRSNFTDGDHQFLRIFKILIF